MAKPVSIRIDDKTLSDLKVFADWQGIKYQALIREILGDWIKDSKRLYVESKQSETHAKEG